jgi:NAD(P)-dependent dehydrogenase (short-subunit alcohol dehydrogenase family)
MSRITTPFGFTSTASEVAAGVDLAGQRAVVTGGASGIGVETARVLAAAGAEVTLAVRDEARGAEVADAIAQATAGATVHVAPLDLTDRASIAAFTDAWDGPLDILVNNAGVMATPETFTAEGWELQFATNHLGHFALTTGLHPALAAAGSARVVVVSSTAHLFSPVVFDDLHFAFRPYDPLLAYAQSKTANVLFAVEASRRWAPDGITANALNPGAILTRLQRHSGGALRSLPEFHKTVEQGAATSVLLATSAQLAGIGGRYFDDADESEVVDRRDTPPPGTPPRGVARYALDPGNAQRLWDLSAALVG